jgi:hypothetical protein
MHACHPRHAFGVCAAMSQFLLDDLICPDPVYPPRVVRRLRKVHYFVANLFALGVSVDDISAGTGYTEGWIRRLRKDPAFEDLIQFYRFVEGMDGVKSPPSEGEP